MKNLTFFFSSQDPGMVVHTFNENTQAIEVGRCLWVQDYPDLHNVLCDSQGYRV